MAHFLLTPFGSAGDVNPFLWVARLLKARGHEVEILTAPLFRDAALCARVPFTGVGDLAEYEKVLSHPDLWKPYKGTALVFEMAGKMAKPFYEALAAKIRPGETVLVAPFSMFAARIAREKFGVPLVTAHLQPVCFLSAHDTPIIIPGTEWMLKLPVWAKRFLFSLPNPADFKLAPRIRALCREIGVIPPNRLIPAWMHSPDANLALFPEWFAAPQPDWPANTHTVGFPLEDLRTLFELPLDLAAWLAEGTKPVLFTPGTGNTQAAAFFREGLAACEKLGLRALLGTSFPDQLPDPLPPFARHFAYLPFSELLPHVAAFVHHGGIGTLSQGFAAGVPQLIMPMGHDQPDNVMRMKRLGVGDSLEPKAFKAPAVADKLQALIQSAAMQQASQAVAVRCREDEPAARVVQVLESVARR
jgi:UDP:flavonoid glycosyltransferase YjiC (YdhE family)